MKTLYFDCFAGISGDMFLGAMLDLGLDSKKFLEELKKIPLTGYEINIREVEKKHTRATSVDIKTSEHHPHRGLHDICGIIDSSDLDLHLQEKIKNAFRLLAEAEAKVHGCTPEDIHFHEVGAVDSIIDISGAFILVDMLSPEKILFSPLNVGSGTVECAHGTMPVPAPATTELLRNIPIFSNGEQVERTTPTGALIALSMSDSFSSMPPGKLLKTGTGAGMRDTELPNILRVFELDEEEEYPGQSGSPKFKHEVAIVIETNIDDMNPQNYETVMDSLFDAGAMDVWFSPITMKKARPALTLFCLCSGEKTEEMTEIILRSTSTLGVRTYAVDKIMLENTITPLETSFGMVHIKEGWLGNELLKTSIEYEDLKRISRQKGIPLISLREKINGEINGRKHSDK